MIRKNQNTQIYTLHYTTLKFLFVRFKILKTKFKMSKWSYEGATGNEEFLIFDGLLNYINKESNYVNM